MAVTTPNMGLRVWNDSDDPYDHDQLADNWAKVDMHDHGPGRGQPISTEGILDGSITADKMAAGVLDVVVSDGEITEPKLATGAVSTRTLAAGAVTNAKIATNAVATAQIQDGAVTSAKLGTNSVTELKIGPGAIVDAHVGAAAAIAESKLALASDAAASTPSRRTLGSGATQACAGNDARLLNARSPLGPESGLKVIRGIISNTGSVVAGVGFSVARVGVGQYDVTFTTPFSGVPSVTSMIDDAMGGLVWSYGNTSEASALRVGNFIGTSVDRRISFIAVGPA